MSFYEAFLVEMNKVTVMADAPAAAVVGACTRAAKRAQMVVDGESVSDGPWVVSTADPGTQPGPRSWVTVAFVGGPWAGQTSEVERVVGPVFAVGHEIGNHYWLDTKSDPPTYHWAP